jgi:hypothetical protein
LNTHYAAFFIFSMVIPSFFKILADLLLMYPCFMLS